MAQTAAQRKRNQRARDRARLGDDEYKRIERDKMRFYRASKRPQKPKTTIIINNQPQPQPQPAQQPQPIKPRKQTPKAPQQLIRAPQIQVKDYVPLFKSPNATQLSDNSIKTYRSQFKKVYELFTKKKVIPDKLKNELIKVLQLKNYNHVYVTKELDFIKDTTKFINGFKTKYPNKNSYKSHFNSTVSISSRIKEFDEEYQILAPINTGLAKSYSDDRNDNTVSFTDNKRIINFTPANIKTTLKSISDLFEKTIFSIYTLQPPRRLKDFAAMKITTETDPQRLKKKKKKKENQFFNLE
jgi:hypothetical protein